MANTKDTITAPVAVITGASRGFGLAIAERFVKRGYYVVMVARESYDLYAQATRLTRTAISIKHVTARACDVRDTAAVASLINKTMLLFGKINVLVCNAGTYGPIGPLETNSWDEWVQTIQTNLCGTVLCCREVVPIMRQQGYGRIITLSGGGATKALPNFSAYAASKAAIVRFTETLARELDGSGVTANSIAPGPLNTRLTDKVLAIGPEVAGTASYTEAQQTKIDSDMTKAVDLVAFLASDASSHISGKLVSALWDNYRHLSLDPDAYTLRRITRDIPTT